MCTLYTSTDYNVIELLYIKWLQEEVMENSRKF